WIRPFLSKESASNWHQQDAFVLVFSGRISTRRWTMVVKGTQEEVLIFILPADKLIGFALSHKNFKPYFSMQPANEGLGVKWKVEDFELTQDLFPMIYAELFEALIRHAKDEANPNEAFSLSQIGIEPEIDYKSQTESEELKRQRLYQEAFFADMRARAEKSTNELYGSGLQKPGGDPAPSRGAFTGDVGVDGLNRAADSAAPQQYNRPPMPGQMPPHMPMPPQAPMPPQMPQQAPMPQQAHLQHLHQLQQIQQQMQQGAPNPQQGSPNMPAYLPDTPTTTSNWAQPPALPRSNWSNQAAVTPAQAQMPGAPAPMPMPAGYVPLAPNMLPQQMPQPPMQQQAGAQPPTSFPAALS
ncbi:MAG: hypothetical protein ACRD3W_26425, partial [Terriglobales bacterium]